MYVEEGGGGRVGGEGKEKNRDEVEHRTHLLNRVIRVHTRITRGRESRECSTRERERERERER